MTTTPSGTGPAIAFRAGPRELQLEKRNHLFDRPIPQGHFALLDFEEGRVALYNRFIRIGNPADYLAGYWGTNYHVPQPA